MNFTINKLRFILAFNILLSALFFFLLIFIQKALAMSEESSWSVAEVTGALKENEKIKYDFFAQSRIHVNTGHYDQTLLMGSMGYQIKPTIILWSGYYWNGLENPPNNEARVFQQLTWNALMNSNLNFRTRSRIEERRLITQSNWSNRFRQLWVLKWPQKLPGRLTPVIWDELFLNINNPNWISDSSVFDQNRLFFGIDIPAFKKGYIEVGYLNRYQVKDPSNVFDHIFYLNLFMRT